MADQDTSAESIRDARRRRRIAREHGLEIERAEKELDLEMTAGGVEVDGNKLTRVEGEERDRAGGASDDDDGTVFEPFNLRREMDHGYFDKDGGYVLQRRDEEADAWETQLKDEGTDKVSKEAAARMLESRQRKGGSGNGSGASMLSREREVLSARQVALLKDKVIDMLETPKETVVRALKRLRPNGGSKKKNKNSRTKKKEGTGKGDEHGVAKAEGGGDGDEEEIKRRKQMFDQLTEYADQLMANGYHNVYTDSRDAMEKSLMTTPSTANAAASAAANKRRSRDGDGDRAGMSSSSSNKRQRQNDGSAAAATLVSSEGDNTTSKNNFEWDASLGLYVDGGGSGWCYEPTSGNYFLHDAESGTYHRWDAEAQEYVMHPHGTPFTLTTTNSL